MGEPAGKGTLTGPSRVHLGFGGLHAGPAPHDIDLMVLVESDVNTVYEACTRAEAAVHRPGNPTILTPEEFAESSGFPGNVHRGGVRPPAPGPQTVRKKSDGGRFSPTTSNSAPSVSAGQTTFSGISRMTNNSRYPPFAFRFGV